MKPISVLMYELDANELNELPVGFQVLRYNKISAELVTLRAGVDRMIKDKNFVYLASKRPEGARA